MSRVRRISRVLAIAGTAGLCAVAPMQPAASQPSLPRTPNLEGSWVTPGGTAYFSFLHRFTVGAAPSYSVANIPTFHLSTGFGDWLSVGTLYATETATVPGAAQELEVFSRQRLFHEEGGWPLGLALKEAYNVTAVSFDVAADATRQVGPVGLLATSRYMTNFQFSGQSRLTLGLGASYAVSPNLRLALDGAMSPMRAATEVPLVWGAGAQMQIPYTPHTLSLQVTNASTSTIQGASSGSDTIRYGFDFTIRFSSTRQWAEIFHVAPEPSDAPEAPATPTVPDATPLPGAESPTPQTLITPVTPIPEPTAPPSPQATPRPAPTPRATPKAPVSSFDAKGFFAGKCASCHGPKGGGGFGPDLRPVEAKGDDFIKTRIKVGSPKGMPPFASQLKPSELEALTAYVKSL